MTGFNNVPSNTVWETWDSVLLKTTALGNLIRESYKNDPTEAATKIAVVPRGGLYVVNILSRMLGMSGNNVLSLGISKYDRDHPTQEGQFKIGQLPVRNDVENQRVLLADEIFDTGETTKKAVSILMELGAASVKTAVIHYKPGKNETEIEPDYYIEANDGWIHYPWEVIDPQGSIYLENLQNGQV